MATERVAEKHIDQKMMSPLQQQMGRDSMLQEPQEKNNRCASRLLTWTKKQKKQNQQGQRVHGATGGPAGEQARGLANVEINKKTDVKAHGDSKDSRRRRTIVMTEHKLYHTFSLA